MNWIYLLFTMKQLYKYALFDESDGEPINKAGEELVRRLNKDPK